MLTDDLAKNQGISNYGVTFVEGKALNVMNVPKLECYPGGSFCGH